MLEGKVADFKFFEGKPLDTRKGLVDEDLWDDWTESFTTKCNDEGLKSYVEVWLSLRFWSCVSERMLVQVYAAVACP